MVLPGGPALDNDPEEHVERPKTGKKKKGVPTEVSRFDLSDRIGPVLTLPHLSSTFQSLITIHPAPPRPLTAKEVRGGAAKWTLKHLPGGTSSEFTDELVPLAIELAGSLPPWTKLTVKHVQDVVDRVYGADKHEVTTEGPWFGLVRTSFRSL